MSTVVQAKNLNKCYGDVAAMDNISFTLEQGSILGLIGPNGAGKTTTLKALLGLTSFEGSLDVLGRDPRVNRHLLMEDVCFIADVGILPRWLKVSNAIDFIEGVHPAFNRERAEALIAETKISPRKKVGQLSKGMITQLHLALILAIDVKLLVLDEPTLGLDIIYQKSFFDRLLNDYLDHETSIIISTHQVEEVKSILTHLVFIDEGRVLLDMAMDDIPRIYTEVLVKPDNYAQAIALKPVYERNMLGAKAFLYENIESGQLEAWGDIHVPTVSDLFIGKVHQARGKQV
jgi:ABC-2 type transport system ATP-binding protein